MLKFIASLLAEESVAESAGEPGILPRGFRFPAAFWVAAMGEMPRVEREHVERARRDAA